MYSRTMSRQRNLPGKGAAMVSTADEAPTDTMNGDSASPLPTYRKYISPVCKLHCHELNRMTVKILHKLKCNLISN